MSQSARMLSVTEMLIIIATLSTTLLSTLFKHCFNKELQILWRSVELSNRSITSSFTALCPPFGNRMFDPTENRRQKAICRSALNHSQILELGHKHSIRSRTPLEVLMI
ncbi:hypothetical protein P167DRAFT_316797 [Morchella conica CCBAS932]|uniref:Uncharacterized protein n=1 Tax=Morchella conica CCBAS932 TaxID=1392247 RepID=A0A3N4LEL8_9PEZI|nr:hypothetical protein P167DRAFT_316797 [Morchella conica CCBAS932]